MTSQFKLMISHKSRSCRAKIIAGALCFLFGFLGGLLWPESAQATDPLLPGKLQQLLYQFEKEMAAAGKLFTISLTVLEAQGSKEIFSHNKSLPLIPASVLKLATSVTALRNLGPEYRFPTEIFVDRKPGGPDLGLSTSGGFEGSFGKKNSSNKIVDATVGAIGRLYLRGYGDPSLLQQDLSELAYALRDRGIQKIEDLVIDDSLFIAPPPASGHLAYQAALSATSLNHNCYRVLVSPAQAGADAFVATTAGAAIKLTNRIKTLKVRGAKFRIVQQPSSNLFNPEAIGVRVGAFSKLSAEPLTVLVKGRIGHNSKPAERFRTVPNPPAYLAAVFRYYLNKAGIEVSGQDFRGEVPATASLFYVRKSKPLSEIVRDLNHYSSNMVAEQLVYALGQDSLGFFRRDLGLQRISETLGLTANDAVGLAIYDGSGLERRNRVSTEKIALVLSSVYPDFSQSPEFISTLSRFGLTGTLSQRELLEPVTGAVAKSGIYAQERKLAQSVWAKTGTLDGVSSLAGYLETRTGSRLVFAVIVNGELSKDKAIEYENKLVQQIIGIAKK